MNSENESIMPTGTENPEKSQLKENMNRIPLMPLCYSNNVAPSPGKFKSYLTYVQGSVGGSTPCTPKYSPSSASLPSGNSRHLTPGMQCYSDKPPHINTYSSTPVKRPKTSEKKRHSFLTPVSSKTCFTPRTLYMKEKTPYSKPGVYNPFDCCPEQLKYSSVSPSMFKEVVSPNDKDPTTFSWAIDHIAILHPASIENSPYNQAELPIDPEYEAKAQDAIDKFFSKAVLPSPWTNSPARPVNLLALMSTDDSAQMSIGASPALMSTKVIHKWKVQPAPVESRNVWTQSEITLPPILPKEVEDVLSSFCTFTTDQKEQSEDDLPSLNSTSLRRKLKFSMEDLTLTSLHPIFNEDSDDDCGLMARSISPIPLEDLDDNAYPWDSSMIHSRSAFRRCDAKLSSCVHLTPSKLRSSSAGMILGSPDLSLIHCENGSNGAAELRIRSPDMSPIKGSPDVSLICCDGDPNAAEMLMRSPSVSPIVGSPNHSEDSGSNGTELLIGLPNVSPIAKWLKKTRKRNHSEEILSSTTAGNFERDMPPCRRISRNLPLSVPVDSSVTQMEDESQFSSSFVSVIASAFNSNNDDKISESLPYSPISLKKSNSLPNEHTFVTFTEEERLPTVDFHSDNNINLLNDGKREATIAAVDGCQDKMHSEMTIASNESRSMFMDVDSMRFENIFCNETNQSQDTGYQTTSFQPSYSSGLEPKNDSIEMEMLKAKVNEKFPNIFGSFNFNTES